MERVERAEGYPLCDDCEGKGCEWCNGGRAKLPSHGFLDGLPLLLPAPPAPYDPTADHEGEQTRALDGAGVTITMPSEDGGPPWSVSFDCDEMIPLDEDEP